MGGERPLHAAIFPTKQTARKKGTPRTLIYWEAIEALGRIEYALTSRNLTPSAYAINNFFSKTSTLQDRGVYAGVLSPYTLLGDYRALQTLMSQPRPTLGRSLD